jgi:hypothetical protein
VTLRNLERANRSGTARPLPRTPLDSRPAIEDGGTCPATWLLDVALYPGYAGGHVTAKSGRRLFSIPDPRSGCQRQARSRYGCRISGNTADVRLRLMSVAFGLVILTSGCGGSRSAHYSTEKFRACLRAHHLSGTQSNGPRSSQVVLVMTPSFAEWLYFFPSKAIATDEWATLRGGTTRRERLLTRLFRVQRANVLVFAPASKQWRSAPDLCL